ncbi:MAG: precorrin-6y C5,15-methyltransferase (decarboxylating) subunit CbiE [Nitrospirota bacterium]
MTKIYVLGIGYKPLDEKARQIIHNSHVILASNRLYEVFKRYEEFETVKDRIIVINNVDDTINFMKFQISTQGGLCPPCEIPKRIIIILASGDPLFFGIGRRVINEFGKNMVEILPDLSSIQMAFSRIKEPWDNAFFMSLHGGPGITKRRKPEYGLKDIPVLLEGHRKIAILTDRENNPAEIARILNSSPITKRLQLKIYVCERLGYTDEKITEGTPEAIAQMRFSEPNVVIILSSPAFPV